MQTTFNLNILKLLLLIASLIQCNSTTSTNESMSNTPTIDSINALSMLKDSNHIYLGSSEHKAIFVYNIEKNSITQQISIGNLPPRNAVIANSLLIIGETDYKQGALTLVNLNTNSTNKQYKIIDQDHVLQTIRNKFFLIERTIGVITGFSQGLLNTSNVFLNINVGGNPQQITWYSDTTAYITRYNNSHIIQFNPAKVNGGQLDSIDLSGYGNSDNPNIPHMSSITTYNNKIFVSLQRLRVNYTPDTSWVIEIDPSSKNILDTIILKFNNPQSAFKDGKYWYLVSNYWQDNSGGIEQINLETKQSKIIKRTSDFSGKPTQFITINDSTGFILLSKVNGQIGQNQIQKIQF